MAKYNIHGGHNFIVPGAVSLLNEVTEDRKVKNELISLLKSAGNTVYDCTDDKGTTQSKNLANIVAKCNAHSVDLDISIHLNAGGGTGVEVLYVSSAGKAYAEKVSKAVSDALGLKNRGAKKRDNLYVLNRTNATAILVECCFVDSKTDKNAWNVSKCAKAIAEAITGKSIASGSSESSSKETKSANVKMEDFDRNSRSQKWIVHTHTDDTFSIQNKNSGLYLSVKDGQMKEDQGVFDYSWNDTNSQRFKVEVESTGDLTAAAAIRCKSNNDYVLQTDDDSLTIGKKTGRYAQRFVFIPTGLEDEYYILAYGSGQAITDLK